MIGTIEAASTLDSLLKSYEERMVEDIIIHAPPRRAFEAFTKLKPSDMRLAKFLNAIRTLGRPTESPDEELLTEQAERFGWVKLFATPNEDRDELIEPVEMSEMVEMVEMVVGLVGRVWQRDFGVARLTGPDDFVQFEEPGFAKIVVGYRFEPHDEGTRLICETRVRTTDSHSLRKFRWYWRAIRCGAKLTVRSGLQATKRQAEAGGT